MFGFSELAITQIAFIVQCFIGLALVAPVAHKFYQEVIKGDK